MAKLAHMVSVEEKVTVAIKETVDFGWIGSSGCSLHSQRIVDGISFHFIYFTFHRSSQVTITIRI